MKSHVLISRGWSVKFTKFSHLFIYCERITFENTYFNIFFHLSSRSALLAAVIYFNWKKRNQFWHKSCPTINAQNVSWLSKLGLVLIHFQLSQGHFFVSLLSPPSVGKKGKTKNCKHKRHRGIRSL